MPRNEKHELQIIPTQQEAARQRFVLALKQDIGGRLRPQLKQVIPNIPESAERTRMEVILVPVPVQNHDKAIATKPMAAMA